MAVQPAPLYRGKTVKILELLLKRDKTVMAVIGEIAHHVGEITDGVLSLHSILLIGEFGDDVKDIKDKILLFAFGIFGEISKKTNEKRRIYLLTV